ncbi:MAG: response regulator [Chitinivibrionales bacterium]|nr:response regulator [Chitinivibrionales bacterium]
MEFIQVLPLISIFASLYLFAYVQGQRQKTTLHRSFLLYVLALFLLHGTELFVSLYEEHPITGIVAIFSTSVLMTMGFLFLNFMFAIVNKARTPFFYVCGVISGLAAIRFLLLRPSDFPPEADIFHSLIDIEHFLPAFLLAPVFCGLYGLVVCIRSLKQEQSRETRQGLLHIIYGLGSGLAIVVCFLVLFPLVFGMRDVSHFATLSTAVMIAFVYRAISKYNFLRVNIEQIQLVFSRLFENVTEAVVILSHDGNAIQMNGSAVHMLRCQPEEFSSAYLEKIIDDYQFEQNYTHRRAGITYPDGNESVVLLSQSLVKESDISLGKILIMRDITDLVMIEEELTKTQQFESLGLLAGGIAHDFNNFLTGILASFSFLKDDELTRQEVQEISTDGEKAARKASHLVNQLLTFARGGSPVKEPISARELIEETISFSLRGTKVGFECDIPDNLHYFDADKNQISQVFQNLTVNASQAMPGGGTIHVAAHNRHIADEDDDSSKTEDWIEVAFEDEGGGIAPEDLPRIFDPYFTTKSSGKGLGLTMAYSIVKKHGGSMTVDSAPGEGTRFTLLLPATRELPVLRPDKQVVAHKGQGFVMVMDDEDSIRNVMDRILTNFGYQVDVTSSGEEALELFKHRLANDTRYRVIITDLTIPGGMGGKELAPQILHLQPDAKIIVSSGYSQDAVLSDYKSYGFSGVISKPYTLDKVRQVFNDLTDETA